MPTPLSIRLVVWLWLIAAVVAGHLELMARLPVPAFPAILAALAALVLLAYFKVRTLRGWIDSLDLRALVLLHLTRFVGFYFLLLYRRGELPRAFAVPGGWGENLVAFLALLVAVLPLAASARRHAIAVWNTIGLIDLVAVVATAAQLGLQHPAQMRALTCLPLSLLPTFLVPLLLATHVIIFVRLSREKPLSSS